MSKINQILTEWLPGDVHSLKWFEKRGVSQRLAYKYAKQSEALEKIGPGVYKRRGEKVNWLGGVRLLQEELGFKVHVSDRSSLDLMGEGHYLSVANRQQVNLTAYSSCRIPKWFRQIDWGVTISVKKSSLFSSEQDLIEYQEGGLRVYVSSRELAILELIETLNLSSSLESVENYMNALMTLRANILQALLEVCNSIKVKRVFLFVSEKLEMPFFKKLELSKFDLGTGKRSIVKGGSYNKKYQITVDKEHEENPF